MILIVVIITTVMVGQARIIKNGYVDIEYPAGESIVSLDLKDDQKVRPGSVPVSVTQLKFGLAKVIEPGVIGDQVTHVCVYDLTPEMHIPPTVKHLVIREYSGATKLPLGPDVYIHANASTALKDPCDHYLFYWNAIMMIDVEKISQSCCKPLGAQVIFTMFGEKFRVQKMVPDVPVMPIEPVLAAIIPARVARLERTKVYYQAKLAYITEELADIDAKLAFC